MTRPSRRVVEEAALICQVAASNNRLHWELVREVNASAEAFELAVDACIFAVDAHGKMDGSPETRAEAEALLRTGWLPPGKANP